VTAEDVARLAGVSAMTVSRVMGGGKNVRAATREAVLSAARQLNYAPNLAARSLASAEHRRIGVLFANPSAAYLSEFFVGMLDEINRRGAQLTLRRVEAGNAADERKAVRALIKGQVNGLLLPPPLSESATVRQEAAAANIPVVAVATGRCSGDFSCVRIDDRAAAYDMTRKLISLGHRRFGFIKGHPNQTASAERLAGFEAALRELAPRAKHTIVQGFFSYQSGLQPAEQLLGAKTRPTAIFASNDDMAAAVVSVAHRRGLDVPRDVSVAGFDDTAVATTLWPELTTIRQPIGEMAAAAAALLIDEIRARRDSGAVEPVDIVLPHTLIERQSTAARRDKA
jgi:LacI family transcriptional regulator